MKINSLKVIPSKIDKKDKIISILLFISFAILPLYSDLIWISTNIILPVMAVSYLFSKKFYLNNLLRALIVIYLFSLFSFFNLINFDAYLIEIKKLTGVLIASFVIFNFAKKSISNLFIVYYIFIIKFLFIAIYSYLYMDMLSLDFEQERLSSGKELGINANAYGYFCFVALCFLTLILIVNKNLIHKFFLFTTFVLGLVTTLLAASRAGFSFLILTSFTSILILFWKEKIKIFLFILLVALSFSALDKKISFANFYIFDRITNFTESGKDERTIILEEGLLVFLDYPFGIGAGQFPYYMLKSNQLNKIAVSHNSYLLLLVNYGLISMIAYLYIFYIIAKNSLILIKSKFIILKRYGLFFLFTIIYFFIYNLFYDMILDLYLFQFLTLVYIHQCFLIKNQSLANSTHA